MPHAGRAGPSSEAAPTPPTPITPVPPPRTLADLPARILNLRGETAAIVSIDRGGEREVWTVRRWIGEIDAVARALEARGFRAGERLGILVENCPEWHVTDFAAHLLGLVTVPIYTTLPADQAAFLLRDSGARALFARDGEALRTVEEALRGRPAGPGRPPLPAHPLSLGVVYDPAAAADTGRAVPFRDLVAQGEALRLAAGAEPLRAFIDRVAPDDLATLIYTSGTTGEPKGVMLTHRNLVANLIACAAVFPVFPHDVTLSFLPLSHVFQRTGDHLFLWRGAHVHYVPKIERVAPALVDVRPTVLPSVPRVYERVYLRVLTQIAKESPAKRRIFRWALSVGRRIVACREAQRSLGPGLGLSRWLAERLVFRRLRQLFGGRVRFAISGGAPLPREVAEFFNGAGLLLLEGYGLTETSPVVTANRPERWKIGSVGLPLPGVEVAIAGDGEIRVRGASVMRGYWGKPAETAEALDRDGWFHTGDIGRFDDDGFLFITDRKKDLLVTAGGKNIAPQPIERALASNPTIGQAVVFGDRQPYLVALLVPNFETLGAAFGGAATAARKKALAESPEVLERAAEIVERVNRDLADHERVRRFRLLDHELTIESGLLTPTMKIRRRAVAERYADLVASMYRKPQRVEG